MLSANVTASVSDMGGGKKKLQHYRINWQFMHAGIDLLL